MTNDNHSPAICAIALFLAWLPVQVSTEVVMAQTAAPSGKQLMNPTNGGVAGTGMGDVPKSRAPGDAPHTAGTGMSVGAPDQDPDGKPTGPLSGRDGETAIGGQAGEKPAAP